MYKELKTPDEVKATPQYQAGARKASIVILIIGICLSIFPIGFWVTTFGVYSESPELSYILGFFAALMTWIDGIALCQGIGGIIENAPKE